MVEEDPSLRQYLDTFRPQQWSKEKEKKTGIVTSCEKVLEESSLWMAGCARVEWVWRCETRRCRLICVWYRRRILSLPSWKSFRLEVVCSYDLLVVHLRKGGANLKHVSVKNSCVVLFFVWYYFWRRLRTWLKEIAAGENLFICHALHSRSTVTTSNFIHDTSDKCQKSLTAVTSSACVRL